jgi:NAD+ synthase (glutamine-hydrolysing)
MQIYIHQTHHTIADFDEIFSHLKGLAKEDSFAGNIHIFPELYLTGYPLQDLCLQKDFIDGYLKLCGEINKWWAKQKIKVPTALLIGGLDYKFSDDGLVENIENVVFELSTNKKELTKLYTKCLLPSYDIFDEMKYFRPGKGACVWNFADKSFGLLICEDMWHSDQYEVDPIEMLRERASNEPIHGIINFSASPFHLGKENSRIQRAKEFFDVFGVPFYYVNRVGSEDEIIFDGASFVFHDAKVTTKGMSFRSDTLSADILENAQSPKKDKVPKTKHSWETLFAPRLEIKKNSVEINELTDEDCELTLHALNLGIQDYAKKAHMNKFLVALSGGMDSALVLTLLKLFLKEGQEVEAVYMPGQFSATLSWDISAKLCENLGIPLKTLPIKFFHSSVRNQFRETFEEMTGLADENIQSRLRGAMIYARSNQTGAMVLNTSNKSELAVGYSTLYGDSVGALSVLGDLYKSEVYTLAKYINKKFGEIIPNEVIQRPPSAELREGQEDQQSLPPYSVLDAILEGHLSYRYSIEDLVKMGLPSDDVQKVVRLCNISEYKRYQFCPVIKIKAKSFGFGRRIPICKSF